jgi:hypothetical protein
MPGAAAKAAGVSSSASATSAARNNCVFEFCLFMFIALIAALLVRASVAEGVAAIDGARANVHFSHQPAEVLRVIGQVV